MGLGDFTRGAHAATLYVYDFGKRRENPLFELRKKSRISLTLRGSLRVKDGTETNMSIHSVDSDTVKDHLTAVACLPTSVHRFADFEQKNHCTTHPLTRVENPHNHVIIFTTEPKAKRKSDFPKGVQDRQRAGKRVSQHPSS
ncbi:hypothetical protein EVAR_81849_1 [Eumeta japonica]|uniref:Uncharacterized protein n=1 Tax=Eumeta variegata TaxID=151549 RepID=A0A4C1XQP8_EUMVA|nr:hypothetical protein EVAR_81849_1 [Eumeta japonica]